MLARSRIRLIFLRSLASHIIKRLMILTFLGTDSRRRPEMLAVMAAHVVWALAEVETMVVADPFTDCFSVAQALVAVDWAVFGGAQVRLISIAHHFLLVIRIVLLHLNVGTVDLDL